jgi:beta-xylosidase
MRKTIIQTGEDAILKLNQTAVLMHRQMKSCQLNQTEADKHISAAQKAARAFSRAYFRRTASLEHLRQLEAARRDGIIEDFQTANERFGRVLKHFAWSVGAKFQTEIGELIGKKMEIRQKTT